MKLNIEVFKISTTPLLISQHSLIVNARIYYCMTQFRTPPFPNHFALIRKQILNTYTYKLLKLQHKNHKNVTGSIAAIAEETTAHKDIKVTIK